MSVMDLPLVAMTTEDDFLAYECFVAALMKPDDYYTATELRDHVLSGYVSAWWMKDNTGALVAWCGMNNTNDDWPGSCNFLGVAVDPAYRKTKLALRLIRHIFKRAEGRPITTYIQKGVETERLLDFFGFRLIGKKKIWNFYVCEKPRL